MTNVVMCLLCGKLFGYKVLCCSDGFHQLFLRWCGIQRALWPTTKHESTKTGLQPWPNNQNITIQHIICNIVGHNILKAFGHSGLLWNAVTCWLLLAQVWKWPNFSQQQLTCRYRVAKCVQHVMPNNVVMWCIELKLRLFGQGLK